jgi:hypothetical protein
MSGRKISFSVSYAATALAVGLAASESTAQTFGTRDADRYSSRQDFALELRVGSFSENIDGQLGLGGRGPYNDIFCSTRDANASATAAVGCPLRFRFGLEIDWQIVRLGPLGQLGVGLAGSWGSAYAKAPATAGMNSPDPTAWRRTAQETTLQVLHFAPMAVWRIDSIARRTRYFPVVPTLKAGLALAPWWVTNGENYARSSSGEDAVGLSQGFFVGGQIAVLLDAFEPGAARRWDNNAGINHSYLFVELNYTYLGGLTRRTLDVGGLAWTAGISIEF